MGMIGRSSCAPASWVLPVFALPLVAACADPSSASSVDQGSIGDRWLSVCASDGECGPNARCLRGMCTLACDASDLEVCASMSADAVCDTLLDACDVPCGVPLACQVLGAGYVCEDSHCRSPGSSSL
jgi:hypothetical protein